ncbi:MAG: isoprenylcysteine carboxylmethyltransferase family protein [Phycisphaerales bacterium]|nr:MAG: isoprenylcysteine carboxylmethyltransferase family protein [Phycisphaerales bacterium]
MVEDAPSTTVAHQRLEAPGIAILVGTFFGPFIEGALLFACAGTMALPRAWFFIAISFIGMFGQSVLVAVKNPELVNHRGRWKKKKDAKRWDKPLVMSYGLLAFYAVPIVIGLDVGRYGWTQLGLRSTVAGTILFAFGTVVLTWAMLVNTHFETVVRIQTDRHHQVTTSGPYAVVRHPGYVGASLWALAGPLIVGSVVGLIPAVLAIAVLVLRTSLEDKTLQRELPGYADYAQHTRYRLLPGLW